MKFVKGNLLESDSQALVNTVNTVGVMGKGIALQFKETFPTNYKTYLEKCKRNELFPGKLLVVKEINISGEKLIINFPTKTEWYLKSKYEYIEEGLVALVNTIKEYNIKSIAIPPLGCGNGGLRWEKVRLLMENYLNNLRDVDIIIYEPNEEVKEILKKQRIKKDIKLTQARSMLLYAMFYYESYGENVSLFVANKLAYFLKRLGEKSFNRLIFEANHYGPYSVGVEHLLHHLNGKYIKGLEQMQAKAFEPLELQYNKLPEISEYVRKELNDEQRRRLSNLIKLIDGFQSALSLEVLATVDFIKKDNPTIVESEIISTIHNWSNRKKNLFKDQYIHIANRHLNEYGSKLDIQ
ncbi:phosphatase [Flavobacterium cyanobacteriorum]|uniref:Phosphatase n=1 Tax=Flavobacterium cyanobacteriorum TaxID=2022802 RepID=A0A255YVS5_9FLAO|nr:macro domain-containing protein [Flavobacterium cyanobacteriorum]OYQ33279.1 phosphatase [Flavobacterium cyanobacteriorum]